MDKKYYTKVFIPKIIFLLIAFGFNPTFAQTTDKKLIYQVYAGGIHAVEAVLDYDVTEDGYDVSLKANTRGWLSSVVPWEGIYATTGNMSDGKYTPQKHQTISVWRDEIETKTFGYVDNNLTSLTIKDGEKPIKNKTIKPELTDNTTDILSATLDVMKNTILTSECNGQSDIYDGKRRFTLNFEDKGESQLRKSKYNIFSGPARFCTVEIEPKGGRWHEKPRGWLSIQEQGRQKGALPGVWMAKVDGFDYALPVKVRVKTDYGTLLMHLTDIK